MTSPDKPTTDVPAETTRDERTVATASPTPESKPAAPAASGVPENGTKATNPPVPAAKPMPSTKPVASATPVASAKPVEAPKPNARPAEEPPTVIAAVAGQQPAGPDMTSATPPPWQRVASDAQYVADRDLPGDGSTSESQQTTRFSDWGYQRSPRSTAFSTDSADPLTSGVVSGSSASSVFAATAGQSGIHAGARPSTDPTGRTTVNFGAPMASSARPPTGPPVGAPSALRRPGRGPRRASLQIKRVDPWSVLKLAFVLSVALFFVWLVAIGVLYGVLGGMGVWDRVNGTYNEFAVNTTSGSGGPLITASRVFGIAAVIGAINIVLFTALATVGSFVYNVSADLAGGLEITLAERE